MLRSTNLVIEIVDDAMEQVLLLLYYGTEKDLGKPVRIDSRIIEAILTLAPYVCAHLERRDSIEEFFWLGNNCISNRTDQSKI